MPLQEGIRKTIPLTESSCGFPGTLLETVISWHMALDTMIADNALCFNNLTLATESLLCFEFIKVKYMGIMHVIFS